MNTIRSCSLTLLFAGAFLVVTDPARSQTTLPRWNMYGSGTSLDIQYTGGSLNSASGAATSNQPALIDVTIAGTTVSKMVIDTGSTGIAISAALLPSIAAYKRLGPGAINYDSSGAVRSGHFYELPVSLLGCTSHCTSNNTSDRTFATGSTTVKVLVVTSDPYTRYFGIGNNRNNVYSGKIHPSFTFTQNVALGYLTQVSAAGMNPLIDVSVNGTALPNQGYVVMNDRIVVGLTKHNNGYSFVQLTPDTKNGPNLWNGIPVSLAVGSGTPGTGEILHDTGIDYAFLTPFGQNGETVQVSMPGASAAGAYYSFLISRPSLPCATATANAMTPCHVEGSISSTPFLNTGRQFFAGFSYLFDPVNGFVGYGPADSRLTTNATLNPMLALTGTFTLPSGFTTDFETYLMADTTLNQTGVGTFSGNISGPGGLIKTGIGTLTISGANSYTGGTFINEGILRLASGASLPTTGALTVNDGRLDLNGNDVTVASLAGRGGTIELGAQTLTVAGNRSTSFGGSITGTGGLMKTGDGLLNLTGANTYTGPTSVTNGLLAVNGSITSDVTVGPGGSLGGAGTISGSVINTGTLAPGNSIGTLTITGNLNQATGATYQVELNNQGQADRTNVTGIATLGGMVNFIADLGVYAPQQTYTILNAAGGIAGTFAGAAGNYAFLYPSLSYDARNAYLTVARSFARGAQTPNQAAVGAVFDANSATATGPFGSAIAALTILSPAAGTAALNALSGQNYSGFSSVGVAGAQLFMSNFAGQAGGSTGSSNRVALAEACDVACDSVTPALWGAWGGAVGGLGTVGGNANAGTLTYNLGGFAGGIDRKLAPDFLMGVTVGFSGGTQWVQGFEGQGTTGTVQAGLYGSYARGLLYVDGLAAYAYSDNQMTRQIAIPGIPTVTAQGRTGVNQVFGQVEAGYRFDIGGVAQAYVTPFARLQAATATQAAFTETGAGALGLSVAAQTTNSLRTVFGAQLGGAMDLGWREKLAMQFRLGWGHEFADTARPVTASFLGAPASPFTTYGAAPLRDSVVLGLAANTAIADSTSAYLRYEGDVSYQNAAHALTAGVRMTW
jgi:autotransporter-associated beta strand protein